jgi:uncharacterized protein (DUF1501 family)
MPTRRQFVRVVAGAPLLLGLAPTVPWLWGRAAALATDRSPAAGRVLVAIQLTGGNDGLNTVVPFADDAYARNRPTLRLPTADLHKLDDRLGLHPRMGALARLYRAGRVAIVQGVGCERSSRDHEVALRTWQTATAEDSGVQTGWLGRAADRLWRENRPLAPAVFVGAIPRPLTLNAATAVVPVHVEGADEAARFDAAPGQAVVAGPVAKAGAPDAPTVSSAMIAHVRASLEMARQSAARAAQVATRTAGSATASGPRSGYPPCALGRELRTVANLIRAEAGIRIYHTELGGGGIGGFDNHANQLGNHCALLEQLSEAVAAFAADLEADRLLDRVLVLTFSEFGRTVAENGRRGTDHGAAGPMLAVGGGVKGGVHGAHPSLTDLDQGSLKHHTDFRAVYGTVIEEWLGLPAAEILGAGFPRVPMLVKQG